MANIKKIVITIMIFIFFLGCQIQPPAVPGTQEPGLEAGNEESEIPTVKSESASAEELAELRDRFEKVKNRQRYGDFASALETYLGLLDKLTGFSGDPAAGLVDEITMVLEEVEASFSLIADNSWLDGEGNQVAGDVSSFSGDAALQPAVVLIADNGRFAVSDVPVKFELLKGEGRINPYVMTDHGGKARAVVTPSASHSGELVIRAQVEFQTGRGAYPFKNVFRDFVYQPPSRRLLILHGAFQENSIVAVPSVTNALGETLNEEDWDVSFKEITSDSSLFSQAFEGDREALLQLMGADSPSFVVMVRSSLPAVRQISFQGRSFELYKAQASSSLRVIRPTDGKVFVTHDLTPDREGQGGTPGLAAQGAWTSLAEDWISSGLMARVFGELEKEVGSE